MIIKKVDEKYYFNCIEKKRKSEEFDKKQKRYHD
jgi:hypothetical protein